MLYEPTTADQEALDTLKANFQKLLPQIDFAIGDRHPSLSSRFGIIQNPVKEYRCSVSKALVRQGAYYIRVSVYKAGSMTEQSYIISFYRNVDRREYRSKTWQEGLQGSKIFVYGETPEIAWDNFIQKFQDYRLGITELGEEPEQLVRNYYAQTPDITGMLCETSEMVKSGLIPMGCVVSQNLP